MLCRVEICTVSRIAARLIMLPHPFASIMRAASKLKITIAARETLACPPRASKGPEPACALFLSSFLTFQTLKIANSFGREFATGPRRVSTLKKAGKGFVDLNGYRFFGGGGWIDNSQTPAEPSSADLDIHRPYFRSSAAALARRTSSNRIAKSRYSKANGSSISSLLATDRFARRGLATRPLLGPADHYNEQYEHHC